MHESTSGQILADIDLRRFQPFGMTVEKTRIDTAVVPVPGLEHPIRGGGIVEISIEQPGVQVCDGDARGVVSPFFRNDDRFCREVYGGERKPLRAPAGDVGAKNIC